MRFNTLLIHNNYAQDFNNSTLFPIYQSTSFEYNTAEQLERIFNGREPGYIYTRINNPTVDAFERRIASIEGGIGAVACSSGMAAITLSIMSLISTGDEIVSSSGIFGGTYSLLTSLENYGVKVRFSKDANINSFHECINEKTKLIFIETIGNPKLDIPNIKEISQLAHSNNIPLIVDNTVTTPYIIKPIDFGADIIIHSTSKYINGSANAIGGVIIDSGNFRWDYNKYKTLKEYEDFGEFAYLAKLKKGLLKDFGACLSPFNAYLTSLGLETLGIRMERMCDNAMKLAQYLKTNNKNISVNYPGLNDNQYYYIASQQFSNKFGAILTIRCGTKDRAFKVINNLRIAKNLANIGDVRTLVIHPASTISANIEEKEKYGVYDDLIRISVGIEDIDDIIEDFEESIRKL